MLCDSLSKRKMYAIVLVSTTLLEVFIYGFNQFIIFDSNDKLHYCDRAYTVFYMVNDWGIHCTWAITIFEIATSLSILFYIYASMAAFGHYHMGFNHPRLM